MGFYTNTLLRRVMPNTFRDVSSHPCESCVSFPFAPRLLWSASHNVKEGDTCPFAISLIWSRYFFSYHTNGMRSVRNVLSWYLPLSLFPSLLRPLAVPRSPSSPPRAAFRLLWATLCIKAGIWVMYKSIWSPFFCTRPTLQFRQAWSVQDLLVRLPWGIPGVWSHLPGYKKTSSLGGREAGRVIQSQKGKEWSREAEKGFHSIFFILSFLLLVLYFCEILFIYYYFFSHILDIIGIQDMSEQH